MAEIVEVKGKRTISSRLSQKVARLKHNNSIKVNSDSKKLKLNDVAPCGVSVISPSEKSKESCPQEISIVLSPNRLSYDFFNQPCIKLAKSLLGKILVRRLVNGDILKGKIVETECYLGIEDKASHSYNGKRTDRNEPMFMKPGTAYVYTIYGMYFCFNISSLEEGSAVLIRALEPVENTSVMHMFRSTKRKTSTKLKDKDLCNGPSKLCQALNIEKHLLNKANLSISQKLWVEDADPIQESMVVACKRIGIDSYGLEWASKLLRFYIRNCAFVSVRNKLAETNNDEHSINS